MVSAEIQSVLQNTFPDTGNLRKTPVVSLRKKRPHFPVFGLYTERYSVLSPNERKCEPEYLRIRTLFAQW